MTKACNDEFYHNFFRKETFLSYEGNDLYFEDEYIRSLGLLDRANYEGNVVLELGAGSGRLTRTLHRLGLLQSARKYIVAEPSLSLLGIQKHIKSGNCQFIRSDLARLGEHVESGSVDFFIASGVIPHIETKSLSDCFSIMSDFIKDNGLLYVNSYHNGPKKRICSMFMNPSLRLGVLQHLISFVHTTLQTIVFPWGGAVMKRWFHDNFTYSFQKTFAGKRLQHLELYSVNPYNIWWGYPEYTDALLANGFSIKEFFPHSLALMAAKSSLDGVNIAGLSNSARTAVIGTDWLALNFKNKFPGYNIILTDNFEEAASCDQIVLAYDYTQHAPFYKPANEFMERGFELGKTLFIFQMLV